MSRYLQNLVMRSLGEASGLSPRPATRYESVRQNVVAEFTESMQERSLQDLTSWISPIETDLAPAESIIERGRQADASLPSKSERALIRQKRQNQSGLFGKTSDEGEITKKADADPTRPPCEVSREGAAELVPPVPRPNTALSDRREASVAPIARRSESLPGMRNRSSQPITVKSHPPAVRPQGVFSDSLRPTLSEGSFHPVRGDMIVPPTEARAPVVHIRIGRIEVRAVEPPIAASNKKLVEPPQSSISLDQYLRRRS